MRAASRVLLALTVVGVVSGCSETSTPVEPSRPAPPQRAELNWVEHTPADGNGLVFEVRRFAVTHDGWRAEVGIRNDSGASWRLAAPGPDMFGVMLFVTGRLDELDRRNKDRTLPGLRRALMIEPTPPTVLPPGARWSGTISAPGALAAGRWVRLVFGPLGTDNPPAGLPRQLVWITDRTLVLHE